ncbi:MAG: A/G-specific adenine glycosylase [Hyphomicrobiales bacterium]
MTRARGRHRASRDAAPPPRSAASRRALRAALLRWYRRERRDLPWRRTRDAYAIWVSEVMLQQTRVETVIPYYERFLARFPRVEALAGARESDVLAAWSGLGYYRRARHLKRAAEAVVREHGGRLPGDPEALRALPGIGAYTAAAIASIGFGRPAAAVDGNVIRVIARLEGFRGRRDSGALRRRVEAVAAALAEGPAPGDWTQALMELGATRCLPREPLCARCPLSRRCRARASGRPDGFPEAAPALPVRAERRLLLAVRRGGRHLLVPDAAEQGAAWTLPAAVLRGGATEGVGEAGATAAARSLARSLGLGGDPDGPVARFRHRTFSHDLSFEVWRLADAEPADPATPAGGRWARAADLERLPVRAPTLKALRQLRGRGHARKRVEM